MRDEKDEGRDGGNGRKEDGGGGGTKRWRKGGEEEWMENREGRGREGAIAREEHVVWCEAMR